MILNGDSFGSFKMKKTSNTTANKSRSSKVGYGLLFQFQFCRVFATFEYEHSDWGAQISSILLPRKRKNRSNLVAFKKGR